MAVVGEKLQRRTVHRSAARVFASWHTKGMLGKGSLSEVRTQ